MVRVPWKVAPVDLSAGGVQNGQLTDEIRANVIAAVKRAEKRIQQIADQFGISPPSVGNIKAAARLTAKRK